MSIMLLYSCAHVELSVADLDGARAWMESVLGAVPVEQELARDLGRLAPDGYRIDHLDCGGATFQLNAPAPGPAHRSIHRRYLDEVGPCVTDLSFYVDDVAHGRELLSGLRAETLMEGPSSIVRSLTDYGAGNTRSGADKRPFVYMGSRELIGFDLEIMEPNFLRFVEQGVQQPCFIGRLPDRGMPGLDLLRLSVVVADLEATYRNLVEIVAPGSRSMPYAGRESSAARAFRITVGGIELEYCQPLAPTAPVARQLERYGPGIVAIHFGATDTAGVLARVARDGSMRVIEGADVLGEEQPRHRWRIESRDLVGFDVVLEQVDERLLVRAH